MIYRIYQPRLPRVRSCVELIWYISQDASEVAKVAPRMIPDGHYHLVIDLGDPHSYTDSKGRVVRARRTHINAHQAGYVDIARSGRVEMMGVMFRPLGFAVLVQQPVDVIAGGWSG
ncbi:DUF6597 domain-containing transcriptional factor [Paenibacillus sp. 1P07SE]|uniref:DUF6597 domain-containing transcriptional factor n=1 Tax=Paenibacillus sp. 1P07SE TaxID=3132209 RepID=UPI0039A5A5CF